jgi:hypothetical protein
MFRPNQSVLCVNGTGCKHKLRAGKTYTVALYRTAAEAMGMAVEPQVFLVGHSTWYEASRFEALPVVYLITED